MISEGQAALTYEIESKVQNGEVDQREHELQSGKDQGERKQPSQSSMSEQLTDSKEY